MVLRGESFCPPACASWKQSHTTTRFDSVKLTPQPVSGYFVHALRIHHLMSLMMNPVERRRNTLATSPNLTKEQCISAGARLSFEPSACVERTTSRTSSGAHRASLASPFRATPQHSSRSQESESQPARASTRDPNRCRL